jgi:hypothetical protein
MATTAPIKRWRKLESHHLNNVETQFQNLMKLNQNIEITIMPARKKRKRSKLSTETDSNKYPLNKCCVCREEMSSTDLRHDSYHDKCSKNPNAVYCSFPFVNDSAHMVKFSRVDDKLCIIYENRYRYLTEYEFIVETASLPLCPIIPTLYKWTYDSMSYTYITYLRQLLL